VPETLKVKNFTFSYDGSRLPHGIALQTRSGTLMKVKSVTLDGRAVAPSEADGCYTWQDDCSTYVTVCFPVLDKGEHKIVVEFE
jgi:hypothetical protein